MSFNNDVAFRTANPPVSGGFLRKIYLNTALGLMFAWDATLEKYNRLALKSEVDDLASTVNTTLTSLQNNGVTAVTATDGSGITVNRSGATVTLGTDTSVLAEKSYVDQKFATLMGGIPATTLDTIKEIADQIASDEVTSANMATQVSNLNTTVGTKANKELVVTTVTANYSATHADDVILIDTTGGAVVVTLPAATDSASKKRLSIKYVAGSSAASISSSAGIDGASTYGFVNVGESISVVSNGTVYYIV